MSMNPSQLISLMRGMDLGKLRERAGFGLDEVAKIMGVDPTTVRRWETKKTSPTPDQILDYLEAIGFQPEAKGLYAPHETVEDPYFLAYEVRKALLEGLVRLVPQDETTRALLPELAGVRLFLTRALARPMVALLGQTNAGKSTVGNELLSGATLPSAHRKLTRVPVVVRHLDHLPRNKSHVCYAFRRGTKLSELADDSNLPEPLAEGDASLLDALGIYVSENLLSDVLSRFPSLKRHVHEPSDVGVILLYVRSPALRLMDLVDTPGVSGLSGDADSEVAFSVQQQVDISIVCAMQNTFLTGPELNLATNALLAGPRYDDLRYIGVSTRGDSSRTRNRAAIMDGLNSAIRIVNRPEIHFDRLSARTFNFFNLQVGRADAMFDFIRQEFGERVPGVVKRDFYRSVANLRVDLNAKLDIKLNEIARALEAVRTKSSVLKVFEEKTLPEGLERARKAEDAIRSRCRRACEVMLDACDKLCALFESETWLTTQISNWYGQGEKDAAKREIVARLGRLLDKDLSAVAAAEASEIVAEARAFELARSPLDEAVSRVGADNASLTSIDMKSALPASIGVIGLASLSGSTIGGALMSMVSAGSAVGAGLGASVGLGGAGAVLGAIASTVLIGIGVVAAMAWLIDLLSSSWQERLARNVAKHFKKSSLRKQVRDSVSAYWDKEEKAWAEAFKRYRDNLQSQLAALQGESRGEGTLADQLTKGQELRQRLGNYFVVWDQSAFVRDQAGDAARGASSDRASGAEPLH